MGSADRPVGGLETCVLTYVDVRNAEGKLLFRYDPVNGVVEIKTRGVTEVVDLSVYAKRNKRRTSMHKYVVGAADLL